MDVKEIEQHLDSIQQQDAHRVSWLQVPSQTSPPQLQDLTSAKKFREVFNDTVDQLKDATTDLSNAKLLSRTLGKKNEELEFKVRELQRSIDKSAFVLVLIDADPDSYVFADKYLLRSTDGGREAAMALKLELQRELRQISPEVADLPFILKLYANIDKLGKAMWTHGMQEASNLLRDFCRGFNQTGGLSEFIDVGAGRDRADHQIKGVLEHFKDNPSCKQIVLGICHDNGYVCDLDVIKSQGFLHDRITLLKSFQTGWQYGDLPFKSVNLPTIFRSETFSASTPLKEAHKISGISSRQETGSTKAALSYAARAGVSDSSHIESALSSPTNITKRRLILTNSAGERIDRFLKKPSHLTFAHFYDMKAKLEATGKRGPCNIHYLGGGCPLPASNCQFWHDGFNEDDISVMTWFLRFQCCENGLQCRSASCFYGHACSGVCKSSCKFSPEMHSVNRSGECEVMGV